MPTRTFAITADDKPVALPPSGTGEISITVANTSARPIRGQARLVPLGNTRQEWLRVSGEIERNFSGNEAHQFVVRMTVPPGIAAGRYAFRLNVVSVQNPDEDYAEGPAVAFELAEPKPAPPPNGGKFPWFYVLLGLILIGGGVAVALLVGGKTRVPLLVGQTLEEVTNTLSRADLNLAQIAYTNAGTVVPGQVARQIPDAETEVKAKSGVTVVVRTQPPPELIPVPTVIGRDSVSAVNALVSARLAVTNLLTVSRSNSNEWNRVVDQDPKPPSRVPAGTPVTLSIGTQPSFGKRRIPLHEWQANPDMLRVDPSRTIRKELVVPRQFDRK